MSQPDMNLTSNRILTVVDRDKLKPAIAELHRLCPDIMSRKIPEAVFQNAFIYEQVKAVARPRDSMIVIGGFEDPIGPALQRLGYQVEITDPQVDCKDASAVWLDSVHAGRFYDIVISCSVLEHVSDDGLFVKQLYQLLQPGGRAFLTTDFRADWREGQPTPDPEGRLYTLERLNWLVGQLPAGNLVESPTWDSHEPYFEFNTIRYCFCALAFRKPEDATVSDPRDLYAPTMWDLSQTTARLYRNLLTRQKEVADLYQTIIRQQSPIELHLKSCSSQIKERVSRVAGRLASFFRSILRRIFLVKVRIISAGKNVSSEKNGE